MLGPKNYPTALQMVNFETDLVKHQKKLEEIHKVNKKKEVAEIHTDSKTRLFEARERGIKFHNTEKHLAIEKDNELLLGKLVEIARKKKTAADFKFDKQHIGTLNAPSRKREKDRIAAENEAFARRLLSQKPLINKKKFELDYEKHNSRVKQMQKVPLTSPRKVKLPPLSKEEEAMMKSKSGNGLKSTKNSTSDKKKVVISERDQDLEDESQKQLDRERIEKEIAELKEIQANQERQKREKEEQELREKEEREAHDRSPKITVTRHGDDDVEKIVSEHHNVQSIKEEDAQKSPKQLTEQIEEEQQA
jgi:hypothetical protein